MKQAELFIEHLQGKRHAGTVRLKPSGKTTFIGSHRNAGLRLVGGQVSPFHAVIEYRAPDWYVYDFGSQTGTWISGETIVERKIQDETIIKIGGHELKIRPKVVGRDTFLNEDLSTGPLDAHQVVVRMGDKISGTAILGKDEPFLHQIDGARQTFAAPKDGRWVVTRLGKVTVQQRLITAPHRLETKLFEIEPDMKKPAMTAGVAFVLLALAAWFMPKTPDDQLKLDKPEMNKYSEIIFNARVVKKKRDEATKIVESKRFQKQIQSSAPAPSVSTQTSKEPVVSAATSKVITKIRAAGLSQLIGKIAKRSAKNATLIQSMGSSADDRSAGTAVAGIGATTLDKSTGGKTLGTGFKLGSVGTVGKGGGGNYKEGVGLGTGKIGQADVDMVDEETIIDGGLDREVIAEVIRRDIGQIRYCYERQLSGSPDLYGKVLVKFTIGADGFVSSPQIGVSTLKSAMVEGCILRRVARWKFPLPKGGTQVLVSYPFLFKSTN